MDLIELSKYGIKEDDPIVFVLKQNQEGLNHSVEEISKKFIDEFSFLKDMDKNFIEKNTLTSLVEFLKHEVAFVDSQKKSLMKLKIILIISVLSFVAFASISSFVFYANYRFVSFKKHKDGTVSYSLENFLGSKCFEVNNGLEVQGKER